MKSQRCSYRWPEREQTQPAKFLVFLVKDKGAPADATMQFGLHRGGAGGCAGLVLLLTVASRLRPVREDSMVIDGLEREREYGELRCGSPS